MPINDKLLHFICFLLATGLFYFIWDVDEVSLSLFFLLTPLPNSDTSARSRPEECGSGATWPSC